MPRSARLLTALSALFVLALFALPLWRIHLIAPQYPEGLGLEIRVNTVAGASPNDLANINELNHYIGMRPIEPAAIPVFRVMPPVVALLAVGGFLVAFIGRRVLLTAWLASVLAGGGAGLVEFWRWEYDYGHHLDFEHAIIKVPGMTYTPPVIGTKQMLNFTAVSWPAAGAVVAALAVLLAVVALGIAYRRRRVPQLVAPSATQRPPIALVRSA